MRKTIQRKFYNFYNLIHFLIATMKEPQLYESFFFFFEVIIVIKRRKEKSIKDTISLVLCIGVNSLNVKVAII